ncbi:hypothetical protein C1I97_27775 [Streptomyces sp. NTH33]|uniref:hypothetical protein n=1 Tax=Streptomyces sp. NTH33 TaxID=1735453 RepID=UPI000DA9B296|nr:hypothetical protein [Streptomyces sp. NTH33]PZG94455.1 hypothetical protein C1I97_27775 [Streptomyces sp. NTH33]
MPSRRPVGVLAAALVTGLLIGGGAVGAAWALSDDGRTTASAPADDARDACRALDRFDESKYESKGSEREIAFNRFAAADVLAASAAAGDDQYKPLAEAIRLAQTRFHKTFGFGKEVKQELQKARDLCGGLR